MPSSMSGANQPAFVGPMDPYSKYHKLPQDEKHCADHSHDLANAQPIHAHHSQSQSHCNDCSESDELHGHNKCHNSRLRRFLVPILASVLSLCLMLAVSCLSELDFFNGIGLGANGLTKRQSNGAGGSSSQDGPFVNNKRMSLRLFNSPCLCVESDLLPSLSYCHICRSPGRDRPGNHAECLVLSRYVLSYLIV